jgi:hypothetical protein
VIGSLRSSIETPGGNSKAVSYNTASPAHRIKTENSSRLRRKRTDKLKNPRNFLYLEEISFTLRCNRSLAAGLRALAPAAARARRARSN